MNHSQAPNIRVLAAVVCHDETYLACQRPAHKRHGGLWEFPGGKCEPGESDLDAAHRELSEELGVDVTSVGAELFAVHDDDSPYLIAFVEVTIAGEPVCHEHTALTWAPPEQLLRLPLAPSDRRFVEHLLSRSSSRRAASFGDTP